MPALVPASPFLEVKQKDEVELVLLCYVRMQIAHDKMFVTSAS